MNGCLCFNCKCQQPEFGSNKWERLMTIIFAALLILSFIELVGFGTYIDVFEEATAESCCGVISESSWSDIPGSVCDEDNFLVTYPKFGMININGSIYCTVNNITCDKFQPEKDISSDDTVSTIEECLNIGGYDIADLCGEDVLMFEDNSMPRTSSIIVLLSVLITSLIGLCEFFGCFRDSRYCQNKCVAGGNKCLELLSWCFLLFVSTVFIENAADNGYINTSIVDNDADDYFYDECLSKFVSWTELDLEGSPEWLDSSWYNALGYIGLILSILDFVLYFYLFCGGAKTTDEPKTDEQMEKQFEMNTTNATNNTATNATSNATVNENKIEGNPQQQQIQNAVYVNQYGQPIQPSPQQVIYVNQYGQPIQPSPLQVVNQSSQLAVHNNGQLS